MASNELNKSSIRRHIHSLEVSHRLLPDRSVLIGHTPLRPSPRTSRYIHRERYRATSTAVAPRRAAPGDPPAYSRSSRSAFPWQTFARTFWSIGADSIKSEAICAS